MENLVKNEKLLTG